MELSFYERTKWQKQRVYGAKMNDSGRPSSPELLLTHRSLQKLEGGNLVQFNSKFAGSQLLLIDIYDVRKGQVSK